MATTATAGLPTPPISDGKTAETTADRLSSGKTTVPPMATTTPPHDRRRPPTVPLMATTVGAQRPATTADRPSDPPIDSGTMRPTQT